MVKTALPTNQQSEAERLVRLRVDPNGRRPERLHMEEGWLRSMGYFSGKQSFYIDDGRVYDTLSSIPEHRVVYRVNMTRAAVARAAAKILNVNAEFRAIPIAGDPRSRNNAETSERLFDHVRDVSEWATKKQMLGTMWAAICGSAFYRVSYDAELGPKDRFYYQSADNPTLMSPLMMSEDDRRKRDREALFVEFAQGDVRIANENPFAVFQDWSSRDEGITGCRWMATRHWMDIPVVAEWLNIDEKDIQADDGQLGLSNYEEAIAFFGPSWFDPGITTIPDDKRGRRTMVVDMWERPTRAFKKGRRIIFAGGKAWVDGKNPYVGERSAVCHLPFVKQDWMPHPGRFWGSSLVEDLVNPQRYLNDARSAMLQFLRCFGNPPTFVGTNSGIDITRVTIEPGGVYPLNETSRGITYGPTPQLPPSVTEIGNLVQSDLNFIASASEIEGKALPGQLRSGAALRQVAEMRDIALNLTAIEAVRATRDAGRMSLALMQMFYSGPRTLKYLGEDGEWTFQDFMGADIVSDIKIVGQPGILDTTANQLAELRDDIDAGVFDPINNPADKDYITSALHYNTSEQAVRAKLQAQKCQEWEIEQIIRTGTQMPVFQWQDHEREARVCKDFMYSPRFYSLPPEIGALIVQHWNMHNQIIMQQQQQQLMMMEAIKGTPGAKGQASQPSR